MVFTYIYIDKNISIEPVIEQKKINTNENIVNTECEKPNLANINLEKNIKKNSSKIDKLKEIINENPETKLSNEDKKDEIIIEDEKPHISQQGMNNIN